MNVLILFEDTDEVLQKVRFHLLDNLFCNSVCFCYKAWPGIKMTNGNRLQVIDSGSGQNQPFDLIICFGWANAVLRKNLLPFPLLIFIDSEESVYKIQATPNLGGVVLLGQHINPAVCELPPQLLSKVPYFDLAHVPANATSGPDMQVLVIPPADGPFKITKKLLFCFNQDSKRNYHFLVDARYRSFLQSLCNDHITVVSANTLRSGLALNNYDVVIASGSWAKAALHHKVGLIVAGSNGLGGLVSASSLKVQADSGFNGRPGGDVGENIPNVLLQYELNYYLEMSQQDQINLVNENYNAFHQVYNTGDAVTKINGIIGNVIKTHELINLRFDMQSLHVSLSHSVVIRDWDADGRKVLYNNVSGGHSAVISPDAYRILAMLEKPQSVQDLLRAANTGRRELYDLMLPLWHKKIILFHETASV